MDWVAEHWSQFVAFLALATVVGESRFKVADLRERMNRIEADNADHRVKLRDELERIRIALVRIETRLGIEER